MQHLKSTRSPLELRSRNAAQRQPAAQRSSTQDRPARGEPVRGSRLRWARRWSSHPNAPATHDLTAARGAPEAFEPPSSLARVDEIAYVSGRQQQGADHEPVLLRVNTVDEPHALPDHADDPTPAPVRADPDRRDRERRQTPTPDWIDYHDAELAARRVRWESQKAGVLPQRSSVNRSRRHSSAVRERLTKGRVGARSAREVRRQARGQCLDLNREQS